MDWDYINDATDPRGVEYSATRRAARAARDTAQNTEDLLDIQLNGPAAADRIRNRRARQATRRAWWRRIDAFASIALLVGVVFFFASPIGNADSGAVRGGRTSGVSQVPDNANAPTRQATLDNSGDMIDSAFCVDHSADNDPQNCLKARHR